MKSNKQLLFLLVAVFIVFVASTASAQPFQLGDVFAAVGNGQVYRYAANGTYIQTLNTGLGGFTTGMAFDSAGNLYVTDFSASAVSQFDINGNPLGTFGSGYSTPESIVFDSTGDVYVGNLGNGIRKYSPTGTYLGSSFTGRVDWIDLDADQCTMLYTIEGSSINRHDVCTNTGLTPFATGLGGVAYALRILPNGHVLLANGLDVIYLNSTGTVIQTYDITGEDSWFALNLDPDGTSFWSGCFGSGILYKFDIASGTMLQSINTGVGGNLLFGVTIFGEITVAVNNPPVCQVTPPGPFVIDENQSLTFDVTASDPDNGDQITLNASGLPSGATMSPSLPLIGPNTGVASTFNWTPTTGQAGNYTIDYTVTDDGGKQSTCSVDITVNAPGGDNTPPSCNLTAVLPGPPKAIEITVQDGESGLNQVMVLKANNATVNIPTITPGTNSPVVVTATKIDNSKGASVALRVVDVAGNATTCDPVYTTISANVPKSFDLLQNYPNPFNPTTTIRFAIPSELEGAANVTLKVYDLSGREVKTLISEAVAPGEYSVDWDATNNNGDNVAGGVYLYRLVAGDYTMTKKMTLLK